MKRTVLSLLRRFTKRPRANDRETARVEAELEVSEAKRDMLLEAQRRDATR